MARQDDYVRYTIRVPSDLYERVQADAESNGRSVNAEITARLEVSFPPENPQNATALRRHLKTALLNEHAKNLEEFRKGIVQFRRKLAAGGAREWQSASEHLDTMAKIQAAIEAIDRAIADEADLEARYPALPSPSPQLIEK